MYTLYIQPDIDMLELYTTRVTDHAHDVAGDAGFDLLCRASRINTQGVLDLGVRCAAFQRIDNCTVPTAFYLYPRSSISSTPLRLANSVGIIDAGYRGKLRAKVDNLSEEDVMVLKGRRLFQVCMPDLKPFRVEIVNSLDVTARGEGGFGSTGL
tara:strand:+ start:16446 stop:16907 length:462 start_codon:yes stop_codon:yes gene_type:complete